MANNTTSDSQFSRGLARALTRSGYSLLTQPERLLAMLDEAVRDDPALSTLKQNCTTELLAPFYELVSRNIEPSDSELMEAARNAEVYLVQERYIEQPDANLLCTQIAQGISMYLHPEADRGPKPDNIISQLWRKIPQPWRKRIPFIAAAAALALLIVSIALSMRITISFDGNGSTSGSMSSAHAWRGKKWTVPKCRYSRSEYEFAGWSSKKCSWSDNPSVLEPGTAILVDEPTTYYAIWAPLASFDPNGASGSMNKLRISPQGKVTLPKNGFTHSGYSFIGWSKSRDGRLAGPGRTVTADGPTTFYAVWRPLASFDSNGGSGSVDDVAAKKDGKLVLPKSDFKRSGYSFAGWSTSKSGSPKSAGSTVTISGPTTFYAIWYPLASFDSNGGSGSVSDVAADEDGRLTLPWNTFTRSNYSFLGWATSRSGTPKDPGETVTISEPTTYYARWGAEVSFDGNGADSGWNSSVYANDSDLATLPSCGFSRTGYVFLGWGDNATSTSYWNPGDHISASSPRTIYALWKLDPNIGDKVDHSCVFKDWSDGKSSLFVYLTNNAPIPLKVQIGFTYYDGSENQLDETSDTVTALAPGQTTLVIGSSDKTGVQHITYSFTVHEVDDGHKPIQGTYRIDEKTCEVGRLVLRITNTSSKAITIKRVVGYGYNNLGGETYFSRYPNGHLNTGESLEVSVVYAGAEWPSHTRTYYVDGYTD